VECKFDFEWYYLKKNTHLEFKKEEILNKSKRGGKSEKKKNIESEFNHR
jgi:hypothetical protein